MIWRLEKNFFLDFDLKGAIEKFVDCFLVYPILKLLIKKRKEDQGMRVQMLLCDLPWVAPFYISVKVLKYYSKIST